MSNFKTIIKVIKTGSITDGGEVNIRSHCQCWATHNKALKYDRIHNMKC